jgi:hypothetical protein
MRPSTAETLSDIDATSDVDERTDTLFILSKTTRKLQTFDLDAVIAAAEREAQKLDEVTVTLTAEENAQILACAFQASEACPRVPDPPPSRGVFGALDDGWELELELDDIDGGPEPTGVRKIR